MRWFLLLTLAIAHADTTAPQPGVDFAGNVIDPRSAKVIHTGNGRCPSDSTFPAQIAWNQRDRIHGPGESQIVQLTRRHSLFASFWRTHAIGAVVDAASGKQLLRLDDEPAAMIEDARGELLALIVIDEKTGEVRRLDPDGKLRWHTHVKELRGDRARAFVEGTRLFVAPYEMISTGAQLYALDWAGGAVLWKGNVREIMAAHSEYLHDVRLSLQGGNVMLEGVESAGCTLQLFDVSSGLRKLELTLTPGGWGR
jgi:hypothetical protein